ncbi:hypothetical protein BHE74_00056811 [Ensete ventricosum]|nr:hypothetical protein BHE74_00056811 [Ensete ventricosum]
MRTRANERDYGCYSHFHHDYGHNIEECHDLKNQIEDLIHRGHLDRYIRKPRELSLCPKGPVERQVDVIIGSPTAGGDSSSAMKAYAHVKVQKRPRAWGDPGITFESKSEYPDHDDALVIMAYIANARLGMTNRDLIPMISTLTGFTGDAITPVGVVTLPMTLGNEPRTKSFMVPFVVVELPSVYNVIIRRPTLNKLTAVVSIYYRSIKFLTSARLGEVRSDTRESR